MQRFSIGYRRAITLSLVLITGICTELSAQFTGSALRLDSTAAGAKVTDPSPLRSIDGDFSVELWIAPEEGGTVLTGRGSTPLAASWSISIGTKGKVTLDLQGRCSGTTSPPLSPQKASVGFGRWNHLALTYSASDSTLTLLLNGAVVLTDQTSCRSIRLGDGSGSDEISIEIGGSDGHAGMKGAIDEVRIWKSLRTVAEIRAGLSISQLADPDLATSWPLDDASRTTLHDGATLVDATLPNYQLPGTPSDIDLLWNQRQATDTSAITISSADLDDGSYLLIGNNGQAMTTTPSAIEGVKRQLRRVWRLNGIDVDWYDVSGAIPDDIAAENLALLVASDSNFIEHARLLYPDIDSASGSFSGHVQITADDSLAYLTLVEIGDFPFKLAASKGYGPFVQTDDVRNRFHLSKLPAATAKVTFFMIDDRNDVVIDSMVVTGTDLAKATWTRQMGDLPVSSHLSIHIESDSLAGSRFGYNRKIGIREEEPRITSSDDFTPYVLSTPRNVTYLVDSLPAQTTSVTFRIVDVNGVTVRFLDTNDQIVVDSLRVEGSSLDSASWQVTLENLDIPLSAELSVIVVHDGGLAEGTEYLFPLTILPAPTVITSDNNWNPIISNNYSRTDNSLNPWEDAPEQANRFSISRLAPRTNRVDFHVLDADGALLDGDTIRPVGNRYLSSILTDPFTMADLPPTAVKVEALIYSQGGPATGFTLTHPLGIEPQAPRIQLDPATFDNVVANPLDTGAQKRTLITIVVEPSSADADSVALLLLDQTGTIVRADTKVPATRSGETFRIATFDVDIAALPYTVNEIRAISYSQQGTVVVTSSHELNLAPPAPHLATLFDRSNYRSGQGIFEHFRLSQLIPHLERVETHLEPKGIFSSWVPEFDGAGNVLYTSTKDTGGGYLDEEFSLSFWLRIDSGYSDGGKVIGLQNWQKSRDEVSHHKYDRHVYVDRDGHLRFGVYNGHADGDRHVTLSSPFTVNDGKWRHVVVTFAYTPGNFSTGDPRPSKLLLTGYVDGKSFGKASVDGSYPADPNPFTPDSYDGWWRIGGGHIVTPWPRAPKSIDIKGNIAEVGVWQKSLDADEIARLYTAPMWDAVTQNSYRPDCRYYWQLRGNGWDNFGHPNNSGIFRDSAVWVKDEDLLLPRKPNDVAETFTGSSIPWSHSLRFNGEHTHLVAGTTSTGSEIAPTDPFSIMFWFRSTDADGGTLFGFGNENSSTDTDWTRTMYTDSAGHLHFGLIDKKIVLSTQYTYTDGEWHHATATYDGTVVRLFVDGSLVDQKEIAVSEGTKKNGWWKFGWGALDGWEYAGTHAANHHLDGEIAEISIWSDAVDYAIIGPSMHAPLPIGSKKPHDLLHYLPLDDRSGNTARDLVSQQDFPVRGGNQWSGVQALSRVASTRSIAQLPPGAYSFIARLFYKGGADLGAPYQWDVTVENPWTTGKEYPLVVESSGGFGDFDEGSLAVPTLSILTGLNNEKWKVELYDSTRTKVLGSKTVTAANPRTDIGLDVGSAEPGSWLYIDAGEKHFDFRAWLPLKVEPIVPPTITGNTGPFLQQIVPGTMQTTNTFGITSFADDVHFIGNFYGPDWSLIDTVHATPPVTGSTWKLTRNMADLAAPYSYLVVETYVGSNPNVQVRDTTIIEITRTRPLWLSSATTISDAEQHADSTVTFSARVDKFGAPTRVNLFGNTVPISAINNAEQAVSVGTGGYPGYRAGTGLSQHRFDDGIPIFGGKLLESPFNAISADVTYDIRTERIAIDGKPTLHVFTTTFGFVNEQTASVNSFSIDDDNNLLIDDTRSFTFGAKIPGKHFGTGSIFKFVKAMKRLVVEGEATLQDLVPFGPYITVSPNIGYGSWNHIRTGVDSATGEWGAIGDLTLDNSIEAASFQSKTAALGVTLGIGLQAGWGVTSIEFDVTGRGLFGSGTSYHSVPEPASGLLLSDGFQFYGELVGAFLWGLYAQSLWGPDMFYHTEAGSKIPTLWPKPRHGWIWSGTAVSGDDKGASAAATIEPDTVEHPDIFVLRPNVWPQPSVSARGDDLTIVHMEQDPVSQIGTILLARYESEANAFADPMIVASNRNGITQPIVVDLSDSIHLVTWTQSRFSPESVGTDRKYGAMLRSLDVWYAVCNSRSGLVEGIGLLDDDLSGHVSGRMEGNPVVAPLSDTRGLITWIVADPSAGESDLFSATVARVDDRWVAQPPERAITISGIEHDLSIAGVDADHAVAAWINKADVESDEQRVFSSEWSDAGWGEPTLVAASDAQHRFNFLDVAARNRAGLLVLTGLYSDSSDTYEFTRLYTRSDANNGWQAAPEFEHAVRDGYLQRPRAAISATGTLVAAIQKSDGSNPQESGRVSQIDLILRDADGPRAWKAHEAHPLLSDTGALISDYDIDFTSGENLLLFANEAKIASGLHTPVNGRYFGSPEMKLVLRAVAIADDLAIVDVDEENIGGRTGVEPRRPIASLSAQISSVSPNPTSGETRLALTLREGARARLLVTDIAGTTLFELLDDYLAAGRHERSIDLRMLPNGLYYVRLLFDDTQIEEPILLVR